MFVTASGNKGCIHVVAWLVICLAYTEATFRFRWPFRRRVSETCYDDPPVGCFPTRGPYRNTGNFQPESPQAIRVQFLFHHSNETQRFSLDDAPQVIASRFDPSLKTVVILHGYFEHGNRSWIRNMAQHLLARESLNVLSVDWRRGANHVVYHQSAANTRMVGAVTSVLLQQLIQRGASPSMFHLIGFSLGAHVAGQVGMRVPGIGRITGLDPAGPCFEGYSPLVRLDPTDADFVDVIHTDAGTRNLLQGEGKGMSAPCGTVDFYPNGGETQPGCSSGVMVRLSRFMTNFDALKSLVGCNHSRAHSLFVASISQECEFAMSSCQSRNAARDDQCAVCNTDQCPRFGYNMGPLNGQVPTGIYRFSTSASWPFCEGLK